MHESISHHKQQGAVLYSQPTTKIPLSSQDELNAPYCLQQGSFPGALPVLAYRLAAGFLELELLL